MACCRRKLSFRTMVTLPFSLWEIATSGLAREKFEGYRLEAVGLANSYKASTIHGESCLRRLT